MLVPFSVADFIDRAVQVYGERVGVVDEPDQPAPSLGDLTYAQVGDARPPPGRAPRRAGRRLRRPGGRGQPQQRAADDVVLRGHGLRPGAGAGELPAPPRRGPLHRRALRRPGAATSTRSWTSRSRTSTRRAPLRARATTSELYRPRGRRAEAVGARGERHRDHQLHLGHDRPAQGRADHPPQHLDQRGHLRAARRRHRPRRLPAHAADVPRQRVGDAVRDDRDGRQARGAAQGRRRRDPAPGRAARRHRHVRGARRRGRRARGRADLGGRDPRPRPGADHHGRRAAADEDRGPRRGGARLGVHPDLRPHRDLAAAHGQPDPRRVGRPLRPGARREAHPGRDARHRRHAEGRGPRGRRTARDRRGAGPLQRRASRATGSSPRRPRER